MIFIMMSQSLQRKKTSELQGLMNEAEQQWGKGKTFKFKMVEHSNQVDESGLPSNDSLWTTAPLFIAINRVTVLVLSDFHNDVLESAS